MSEPTHFAKIARDVLEVSAGPYYVAGNETQRARVASEAGKALAQACSKHGHLLISTATPEKSTP